MERPTCGTCPYWAIFADDDADPEMHDGWCQRHPPVLSGDLAQEAVDRSFQPVSSRLQSCGEHPDFPAYIAGLKESKSPAD